MKRLLIILISIMLIIANIRMMGFGPVNPGQSLLVCQLNPKLLNSSMGILEGLCSISSPLDTGTKQIIVNDVKPEIVELGSDVAVVVAESIEKCQENEQPVMQQHGDGCYVKKRIGAMGQMRMIKICNHMESNIKVPHKSPKKHVSKRGSYQRITEEKLVDMQQNILQLEEAQKRNQNQLMEAMQNTLAHLFAATVQKQQDTNREYIEDLNNAAKKELLNGVQNTVIQLFAAGIQKQREENRAQIECLNNTAKEELQSVVQNTATQLFAAGIQKQQEDTKSQLENISNIFKEQLKGIQNVVEQIKSDSQNYQKELKSREELTSKNESYTYPLHSRLKNTYSEELINRPCYMQWPAYMPMQPYMQSHIHSATQTASMAMQMQASAAAMQAQAQNMMMQVQQMPYMSMQMQQMPYMSMEMPGSSFLVQSFPTKRGASINRSNQDKISLVMSQLQGILETGQEDVQRLLLILDLEFEVIETLLNGNAREIEKRVSERNHILYQSSDLISQVYHIIMDVVTNVDSGSSGKSNKISNTVAKTRRSFLLQVVNKLEHYYELIQNMQQTFKGRV